MHLSDRALPDLSRRVATPTYDRRALRSSIVHIGVGGFHRAHQGMYLDALARSGDLRWGETGVGLNSTRMKAALGPQDGLYTVVERTSDLESATVVGVITDYLYAPDSPRTVIDRLADPTTRIVTLTVTGDGYNLDINGDFRAERRAVREDASRLDRPTTWFGYVVAALARRRAAGLGGLTILSCDNLANSGAAAETAVVAFARTVDETLARWIEHHVAFPNSMVDRITPAADEDTSRFVERRYGVVDRAPVLTEPFSQWVVEDEFACGRPPLEDVGVQFVSDVAPYKLMKSRLLNGTHSALAYLGYLAGHRTTAELMRDPVMHTYLARMMRDEMAPLLPRVPGVDLGEYQATLLERFANENISDALSRLCARGSTKVPSYLLPSLVEARRAGHPAPLLTLATAAWFRYLRGTDLAGSPIEIEDVRRDALVALARAGRCDPAPLLSERSVMGEIGDDLWVRRELGRALRDLDRVGPRAAVRMRLGVPTHATLLSPAQHQEGSAIS